MINERKVITIKHGEETQCNRCGYPLDEYSKAYIVPSLGVYCSKRCLSYEAFTEQEFKRKAKPFIGLNR